MQRTPFRLWNPFVVCAPLMIALIAGCSGASSGEGTGGESGGSGGSVGTGGVSSGSGGTGAVAGAPGTGGMLTATGGSTGSGGSHGGAGGGATGGSGPGGKGGASPATGGVGGGGKATGGTTGSGGGAAGSPGSAGASGGDGPCDIYKAAGTPCVAAHSTVRALYAAYAGALYQVRRASDGGTKDVPVMNAGGFADVSVQTAFCSGTKCTISILYDQSSNHNHLVKSPVAHWLPNGGTEADAAAGQISVNGHTVHGIYVTGYSTNVAYRNNATTGVAKGDQPEAMYMVVDGKRYSDQCCFDYGNAESDGVDDGNGTMEAVYWGSDTTWGGKGSGSGPWVAADLENGMFKSNQGGWQTTSTSPNAKSVVATFATAMLKGPSGNHFTLKAGSAQSGTLTTMWDGVRPSPGYSPKKLQGAIILGTGGDGSNGGTGTFFEGAMTSGNPSDATDDAIQANIVAAGYGR
jgi:Alpha-L-arabinofuranosidase B, catalytic